MKNKEQFKQLKQLAKEAYNSKEVCQEWKDKILKACHDVKPKLEEGKWYRAGCYLIFLEKIHSNKKEAQVYGFNNVEWYKIDDFIIKGGVYTLNEATEEEVKEALIKEAKRRGFKEGCGIISVGKNVLVTYCKKEYDIHYCIKTNRMWIELPNIRSSVDLFINGKWVEIIEDTKEIEVVEHEEVKPNILELNGKKYKLIPMN